jgi:hypothetical protein
MNSPFMNSKRAVIGVAALSAFMGGLVAFLALLSRNEDNASATANKHHKTRSFAINLLTGVSKELVYQISALTMNPRHWKGHKMSARFKIKLF